MENMACQQYGVGKLAAGSPPCCLNFFCGGCCVSQRGAVNILVHMHCTIIHIMSTSGRLSRPLHDAYRVFNVWS